MWYLQRNWKKDDYNNYNQLKEKLYNAILEEFYSTNGRLTINTKIGYLLALYYSIYREGHKDAITKGFLQRLFLDGYELKTGFAGTPLILLALFDNGLDWGNFTKKYFGKIRQNWQKL